MRAADHVGDDLGFHRVGKGRLEHADDGGGASAEPDGFAEHRGIAVERGGPEAIGQDQGGGSVGTIVGRAEETAENRAEAHDLEIGSADHSGADFAGLAEANEGEGEGREIAEGAHRFDA